MGEAKNSYICLIKLSKFLSDMAGSISKDSEVQIFREDQVKINTFAKKNHKLQELQAELSARKKELQNLEDAETELMMLDEDAEAVPIQVGEVFMLHTTDAITSMLERAKEIASEDISKLQANIEAHQEVLKNLKVQLYAKFG